uniref:Pro-neuregulin-2, membrane-bound isoform n=1 Tax=Crocodylus porosus TaxID=8502 RepID=A0A7M4DXK1_CROPO
MSLQGKPLSDLCNSAHVTLWCIYSSYTPAVPHFTTGPDRTHPTPQIPPPQHPRSLLTVCAHPPTFGCPCCLFSSGQGRVNLLAWPLASLLLFSEWAQPREEQQPRRGGWPGRLSLPCLLHWDRYHGQPQVSRREGFHLSLIFLFAAVPPKLKKLKSPNVHVGDKISLKCEATSGNPQPSYKWFKDGKELKKSKDIRIKYGNGKKISRLQFNKVKLEDAGEYSCEAENVLGKDTAKGSLNVRSVTTTLSSWSGHARKCNETAKSYCVNGGVCYYIEGINQLSCKCPNGFFGQRCLEKLPLRLYMPDPKQSVQSNSQGTGVSTSQWSASPVCLFLLLSFPVRLSTI